MIEIWCPKDGNFDSHRYDCDLISIPEKCCGQDIILVDKGSKSSCANFAYARCHCVHLFTWSDIWNNFGPNGAMQKFEWVTSYGANCISCHEYNEYVKSNHQYKCYSCRI